MSPSITPESGGSRQTFCSGVVSCASWPPFPPSAEPLIVALPAHPILTVATGMKLVGRSKQAVNGAKAVRSGSGVLRPFTLSRRNRAWEAPELFDLVDDVERELATPYPSE